MKRKPTKRAKGTGSIFFHKQRQVWVGRVPVGRNAKGKVRYAEKSHPEQTELVKLLSGVRPPGPTTTVAEWGERWLSGLNDRHTTTHSRRNVVRKHVIPSMGPTRVAALTPHDVNEASAAWLRHCEPSTVRTNLAVLGTMLQAAVLAGLRADNPVRLARRPRVAKTQVTPFTDAETREIVREASSRDSTLIFAFLATTGARVGEAMALTVQDWDGAAGTATITKTLSRGKVGPPKTANGVRTIRVPSPGVPAMRAAAKGRKSGPLFGGAGYAPVRAKWVAMLKRLGIPPRPMHQLRHSWASNALACSKGIAEVARYLGDTPETVLKTYVHATDADPSEWVEEMFKRKP